jgi:ribosomal protein L37AE/L43A
MEPPECPFGCDVVASVERVGQFYVCSCCGKSWRIGTKRPEPKTDIAGVMMEDDG